VTYKEILDNYSEYLAIEHPLHLLDKSSNPWEVSLAVMLSGHCTDAAVNKVIGKLLEAFPTPESILEDWVTKDKIISLIPGISHSGSKADYAINIAKYLITHNGHFEDSLDKITEITGIGRKTGSIVLFRCYGSDYGFPLDTHCLRVLDRLGWYPNSKPKPLEKALLADFAPGTRHDAHIILTQVGRLVCHPKNPKCAECKLRAFCKFGLAHTVTAPIN